MTTQRVVAIIGAGGSLGAAIAERLAGEPDTALVLSDVSEASLEGTLAAVTAAAGPVESLLARAVLVSPSWTIRGGTTEVLRGIISKGLAS